MRIAPAYRPPLFAFASLFALPAVMLAVGLTPAAATDVVIFAIAAMGLNILVGNVGLVSFGHGAFFGFAGHAVALLQRYAFPDAILAPSLLALAGVAVFAVITGLLVLRHRGAYFPLLTFILPVLLLAAVAPWRWLTGASRLGDLVLPKIGGIYLGHPWITYAFVAAVGFAALIFLWCFHRSPVGHVLVAIRANEARARHIGYAADGYKLLAFTLSATLTGLAGVLFVLHYRVASDGPISILFSGSLLAMIVIGGMRSFLGPALGALIFVLLRDLASLWTSNWLLLAALLSFGFLMFFPDGVAGLIARWLPAGEAAATGNVAAAATPLPAALARRNEKGGAVLVARELTKSFGAHRAVAGVDIVVEPVTLHALVGPNGAGKTTVLDLLSGRYPPDTGFVTVAGRAVAGRGADAIARAGVGRSFQIANLFGTLTVAENLRLAVQVGRPGRLAWWRPAESVAAVASESAALIKYLGLAGREQVEAASLTLAEQRRLDLALALAPAPRVLLLDEPLAGLAEPERKRLAALIKEIARRLPVLQVERDIDDVAATADVVTVIHEGRAVFHGDVVAARADAKVRAAAAGSGRAQPARQAPPSAAGGTTLLRVEGVGAFYGKGRVLDGISLDVSENEIVALLGRNGAGKSTLLKTLIGTTPPASGSIVLAGAEIARLPSAAIARRGVGYVPQDRGLIAGMTVADNLALGRQKHRSGRRTRWDDERIIWLFPRLARRWYTPADALSRGEQRMAAVARALAGDVRLLLLDEPFAGLPGAIAEELFEAFNRLRYEVAMLIVDHTLDLALALADRALILEQGAVIWTGPSWRLRDDAELRRLKLGK